MKAHDKGPSANAIGSIGTVRWDMACDEDPSLPNPEYDSVFNRGSRSRSVEVHSGNHGHEPGWVRRHGDHGRSVAAARAWIPNHHNPPDDHAVVTVIERRPLPHHV